MKSRSGLRIGVAFDYMRVKVKDIALLEKFSPVFRKLYEKDGLKEGVDRPADMTRFLAAKGDDKNPATVHAPASAKRK